MPSVIYCPQLKIPDSFLESYDLIANFPRRQQSVSEYMAEYLNFSASEKYNPSTQFKVPGVLQIKSFWPV